MGARDARPAAEIRSFLLASLVAVGVFSIVLFRGGLLAIGDGLVEGVPAFYSSLHRWAPNMFAGFPISADPNKATWYPLRMLALVPDGYDAYIVAAYALASWAVYRYVRSLTMSTPAAIASAASFTYGGFMISHLGHPMIIEPACWFCVAIWSLDAFLRSGDRRRLFPLSLSVALSIVAGQPQVAAFALPVLLGYLIVVGYDASQSATITNYRDGACALVLGIGAATVAWLPTIVLARQSVRDRLDFSSFVAFSIPPGKIAQMLVYPFASDGGARSLYPSPVVPGTNFVETSIYATVAALMLAPYAPWSGKARIAFFWLLIAAVSLALSVGDALPLAWATFHVPGYRLFRIPGRHAFEFTFAVAILAGLGIAGLSRRALRTTYAFTMLSAGVAFVTIATVCVIVQNPKGFHERSIVVFAAVALVQIALVAASVTLSRRSEVRAALACSAVVLGSCVFATTAYWRDSPSRSVLDRPAYANALEKLPIAIGQRIYTESNGVDTALEPNLPALWNVPEFGGYTPLQLSESVRNLRTGEDGRLLDLDSRTLDVAGLRYVVTDRATSEVLAASNPFSSDDLNVFLSSANANAPSVMHFGLPQIHRATAIGLVSALGDSVAVPQGSCIASVVVRDTTGASQTYPLRAGLETAELFYDRPDVAAVIAHRKPASVFEPGGSTSWYAAVFPVRLRGAITSVTIRSESRAAALNVRKLSLIDARAGEAYPYSAVAPFYGVPGHFRHVTDVDGYAIFENLRASDSVSVTDGTARVTFQADERRDVAASCRKPCSLTSATTFYDGWNATIDGRPTAIVRDGGFQKVVLPAGRHTVSFSYDPISTKIGTVVSVLSILASALLSVRRRFRERERIGSGRDAHR